MKRRATDRGRVVLAVTDPVSLILLDGLPLELASQGREVHVVVGAECPEVPGAEVHVIAMTRSPAPFRDLVGSGPMDVAADQTAASRRYGGHAKGRASRHARGAVRRDRSPDLRTPRAEAGDNHRPPPPTVAVARAPRRVGIDRRAGRECLTSPTGFGAQDRESRQDRGSRCWQFQRCGRPPLPPAWSWS